MPQAKQWGPYPLYTAWGLIPALAILIVLAEDIYLYAMAARNCEDSAQRKKLKAFFIGNIFAMLVLVDFVSIFGFDIYPFGFAVIICLNAATLIGLLRYQLVEIMPEFADAQILNTLPDGVLVLDSTGIVRFANNAGIRMLGCESETVTGRSFINIAPDSLLPLIEPPVVGSRTSEIQLPAKNTETPL